MASDPRFVDKATYYGKSSVKVMRLHQEGLKHFIREFEVDVHLKLLSRKDFTHGDNGDIIATDTQKNTVYALAKTKGVSEVSTCSLLRRTRDMREATSITPSDTYIYSHKPLKMKYEF